MISIRRFLDQYEAGAAPAFDEAEALRQALLLLLDGIATHSVRGRGTDLKVLCMALERLVRRMGEQPCAMGVLNASVEAVKALETYGQRTSEYIRQQDEQMRSMVAMLTEIVAEVPGQTESSVARLQAIEKQIERASGLDDIRMVRANLKNCLLALRNAAAQQRSTANATVQRLQSQINAATGQAASEQKPAAAHDDPGAFSTPELPENVGESSLAAYVAAFKLQRADHIVSRFGEHTKNQMVSVIGAQLKTALGPEDRLMRWKGASYLMFFKSAAARHEIRAHLLGVVTATGQQHVEVGRKSALLSVGVDWALYAQPDYPSLAAVLADVDAFLANTPQGSEK
jgi:hypothetical protein